MTQCLRQIFHSALPRVEPVRLVADKDDNSPLLCGSQLEMFALLIFNYKYNYGICKIYICDTGDIWRLTPQNLNTFVHMLKITIMLRDISPSTEQSILTVLYCSEGQSPLPIHKFLLYCGGLTSAGHQVSAKLFITLPSQQDLCRKYKGKS